MQQNEHPTEKFRTKISKGFQVVVPSKLRKRYSISVGDVVLWKISNSGVSVQLQKKPSLTDILALGHSGKRSSTVELKKRIQKGEV
jgi:bifunctional DNA-binding transcriptional regulator/antitoxin component of YhaV-PrlF toxin-antitoxin module